MGLRLLMFLCIHPDQSHNQRNLMEVRYATENLNQRTVIVIVLIFFVCLFISISNLVTVRDLRQKKFNVPLLASVHELTTNLGTAVRDEPASFIGKTVLSTTLSNSPSKMCSAASITSLYFMSAAAAWVRVAPYKRHKNVVK